MSPLDQGLLHLPSSTNLREQLPDCLTPSCPSSLSTWSLPKYNLHVLEYVTSPSILAMHPSTETVYSFLTQAVSTPLHTIQFFLHPGSQIASGPPSINYSSSECLSYISLIIPLVMPHIGCQFMSRKSTSLMLLWLIIHALCITPLLLETDLFRTSTLLSVWNTK